MTPEQDDIDPQWWTVAFDARGIEAFESPELLSLEFSRLLKEPDLGDTHRQVLEALATATSAMLKPGDWLQPFTPAMEFGDRRSPLPSDLGAEQIALLARIAPSIEQPSLRARVADVAWTYGDRSNTVMLDLAIDAYRSVPLADDVWFDGGKESWQRAFELVRRRGSDGGGPLEEMIQTLKTAVLDASIAERFRVPDRAALLRENLRSDRATSKSVADHLVRLASDEEASPRLSRHLEREAAAWYGDADSDAANACGERAARTYIAEADARVAADPKAGALVEGHFLEKAIAVLRTLPRRFRAGRGIEDLIVELRTRLASSREVALEAMMRIESDPVDLTDHVAHARSCVSGKSSAWEALVAFATLMPPMDAEQTRASAKKLVEGSISRLFGSSTFSRDGRKVAARQGSVGELDEAAIWAEIVRTVAVQSQMVAQGMILPAQQVLTLEHVYSRELMTRISADSPVIPEGHAHLWGAGLALGLSGEYGTAIAVLVPQLEHLIRVMLKNRGAHTMFVDEQGVESEKSLSALLDLAEAAEALGAGMVMEFKALLVQQGAANLRNDIAHGLMDDAAGWSYSGVYVWWCCLRLVVWPLWQMSRSADGGTADEA